jgi:hypothetical protein
LFDSLTTGVVRYLALNEPDFYANLDIEVIEKFAPQVLAQLPREFLDSLDSNTAARLTAIAAGEQPSAAQDLASLYTTDIPATDPNAPALNAEWQLIANFIPGIELNNADDLLRFPDKIGTPAEFINSFFNSPQGAGFAPGLIGGLSVEAVNYIGRRDPNFLDDLSLEALQLLSKDVLSVLSEDVQSRAAAGGEPFKPTTQVTRTNGASSLLVTIFKTGDANSVQAYHEVEEILKEIDESNDTISVSVAFEQASFVEESISGVAREGSLGAFFAIVVILLFLSGGAWRHAQRRMVGAIMTILFMVLLAWIVLSELSAAGGDIGLAFSRVDIIIRL